MSCRTVQEGLRKRPERGPREQIWNAYRELFPFEDDDRYAGPMAEYLHDPGNGEVQIRRDPKIKEVIFLPSEGSGPEDLWAAWSRLRMPVLIVRAEKSQMLGAGLAQSMCQANSRALAAIIPGVGHNIPAQAPAELARQVLDFLSGTHPGHAP